MKRTLNHAINQAIARPILSPLLQPLSPPQSTSQRGFSLVIVLLILLITSLLSAGASQIALMGERSARSDRDQQVAWQSAEAALADAELEMNDKSTQRYALFDGKNAVAFVKNCGTSGQSIGLCAIVESGKPAWLTANFNSTANDAPTVAFGRFTGQKLQTGEFGVQPSKLPRYVIEILPDPTGDKTAKATPTFLYRVTAMGFGPRPNIQTVLQTTYRK